MTGTSLGLTIPRQIITEKKWVGGDYIAERAVESSLMINKMTFNDWAKRAHTRKLYSSKSHGSQLTISKDIVNKLKWKAGNVVVVMKRGKGLQITRLLI